MCVYPALPRKYLFSNPVSEFLESDIFENFFPVLFLFVSLCRQQYCCHCHLRGCVCHSVWVPGPGIYYKVNNQVHKATTCFIQSVLGLEVYLNG